jgi:hypothetical protein
MTINILQEVHMKQWIAEHVLTDEELRMEETIPISTKEFTMSLSLVGIALALFGIIVRVLGA